MRRLPWILCAVSLALLAAGWILLVVADDVTPAFDILSTLALASFPVVGALIASRRPGNAIGWLFCVAGLLFVVATVADVYAELAYNEGLAGGAWAAWLASWLFLPPLFGTPALLFLLFPDGRLLSPRLRWALALAATGIVLQAGGSALAPGELVDAPVAGVQNPAAVGGGEIAAGIGWGAILAAIVLGAAALVMRFRRARGEERLQLKWFAYAGALFALSCTGAAIVFYRQGEITSGGQLLILTTFAAIPIAAAIAILRHQLYDIDVVIRRTLVYGALTATLAAGYLACVLLGQLVVGADSDLAVAGSTLAMAALFQPARSRIQAAVDRRFYRRRYDAARTLEAFGGRLREELDLEALAGDLRAAVRETVEPAHVSVWLRGGR